MALRKRIKTTPNRGTQLVNIPIRIHNIASVLIWEVVEEKNETLFEGSARSGDLTKHHLGDDSMRIVRRFLAINPEDEKAVLQFLVYYGEFRSPVKAIRTSPREHSNVVFEVIPRRGFEKVQDYVRRMLITGNATLPAPWQVPRQPVFEIFFGEGERGSQAHVWVDGVYPSMLATIQFKLLQGAIFRTCARKDCRLPFEVTSRHSRRFCTQYCAHITSLRQRRRSEKGARKQGNRNKLARKGIGEGNEHI